MDPELAGMIKAELAQSIGRRQSGFDQLMVGLVGGINSDQRGTTAAVLNSMIQSDDPQQYAGLNSAVRIPTTLDHPGAVVGK